MRIGKIILAAIMAASVASSLTGQTSDKLSRRVPPPGEETARMATAVESLTTPLTERDLISGAILISKGDDIILSKGFGYADREQKTLNTEGTIFRLASVSKSITAVAVLQLGEKGLLSLDSRLESLIPGIPNGERITIGQLLSHSSGIPSDVYLRGFAEKSVLGCTLSEGIDWIREEAKPRFEPGERFDYSNSGYVILTAIIEKLSGMTFERYLAKNIFGPAGMNSSGLDSAGKLLPGRARGYSRGAKGEVLNCAYRDPSFGWGCGALYSTVSDLLRFNRALIRGRLLSRDLVQLMWQPRFETPWKNEYGLGWFLEKFEGVSSVAAVGSTLGFVATMRYFPERDILLVVLLNHDFMLFNELFKQLALIALGKPWEPILEGTKDQDHAGFSDFIGTYKMEDGTLLELRRREGRLEFGEKGSGPFFSLYVISGSAGYVAAQNALLRFRKSERGDVEVQALYGVLAWSGRRIADSERK